MTHTVLFNAPTLPLGKSDVEFIVKENGNTLGTLTVSNGAVVLFPAGTTYGCKMQWSKFDRMMRENSTESEAR